MANQVLRDHARVKDVRLWEVAARMGFSDSYFSRKMRRELTQEETRRAMKYIDEIAEGRETLCPGR